MTRANTKEILLAKLIPTANGCLEWHSASQDGYGKISFAGKPRGVHRVLYELEVGKVPEGLVLDHLCRNRRCANVKHLEIVTNAENLRRGERWKFKSSRCSQGHEYTPENTHWYPDGKYGVLRRVCRTCAMLRSKQWLLHKAEQRSKRRGIAYAS